MVLDYYIHALLLNFVIFQMDPHNLLPAFLLEFPLPLDFDPGDPDDQMLACVSGRLLTSHETYTTVMENWGDYFPVMESLEAFHRDFTLYSESRRDGKYLKFRLFALHIYPEYYLHYVYLIVRDVFKSEGYLWAVVTTPLSLSVYPK